MRVAVEHLIVPKDGERLSGDAVFVKHAEEGSIFSVIDALGHGDRAAATADVAIATLAESTGQERLRDILDRVHAKLRGTRGAAGMICTFRDGRLEGCGVGNIDLVSIGTRVQWLQSPGILGASLGRVRIFEALLSPGDRLILFSDGISPRFDYSVLRGVKAQEACRTIMNRQRRSHDDSTVLIADIEP